MLDHFTILTPGGLVLWSRSFTPSRPPLDSLIREALIEQRATTSTSSSSISRFDSDQSTLLYSFENSLPLALVFVVSYQRILNLSYPNELLEKAKKSFVKTQGLKVESLKEEMSSGRMSPPGAQGFAWNGWDDSFDKLLKELEGEESLKSKKLKPRSSSLAVESANDISAEPTPPETPSSRLEAGNGEEPNAQTIARNIAALKARQKAASRASKGNSKRGAGSGTDTDSNAGSESDASPAKPKRPTKTATKWADSSLSAADLAAYDYSSSSPPEESTNADTSNLVSKEALGTRDESGMYEVADYSVAEGSSDSEDDEPVTSTSTASSSFSSFFSRLNLSSSSSSSSKVLTKADLAPILQQTQSHLTAKNVASPIAASLVESIGLSLEGKPLKSSGWTRGSGVRKEVKAALLESLTKVLTPKTSTDLLLEITRKRSSTTTSNRTINTRSSAAASDSGDPYSMTFVGVNGVGKSTNLSKVAFWLLQNKMRVLIAACDTFRSGAVEQLRIHVNNLGKLDQEIGGADAEKGKGKVELFEKGYGKDAAGIAKDALSYAKSNGFDIVLIDTAGRMQDNEPLMRALAKLVTVNQPDKIIFVGEALVGNEAVDQLTKFDRSLKDFSTAANGSGAGGERKQARGIDGMILTKFDTIDDKVGAALSMTYTTGQPIYFVGCGQTYSDLRMLRVNHIVQALLQD
ncbi:signal recognition particle receptor subunit alpha [Sporobolomyces salmoneus]|uniref:signal recognition particle receptor subunit alpha n=1 Tax=Sporobolomyces salmoneus TaxID=183962 RepID=UPI00317CF7A0